MADSINSAVMRIAEKHFGNFKIRNNQVIAEFCPFCNGGDSRDQHTFAVGLYNGAWNCMRGSCNKSGSLRELSDFLGEKVDVDYIGTSAAKKQKKEFIKLDPNAYQSISDEAKAYLARRCISEETVNAWGLMSDKNGNIVFPFYRDKILTYVKYRRPVKNEQNKVAVLKADGTPELDSDGKPKYKKLSKEWQEPNTESILFGMDMVTPSKPLVITEGEIDALSVYEAGYHNVVSVPCGCNNLEWIETCYEWLEDFQQIILLGDNDECGIEMINTISKRLGEDRCMMPPEYPTLYIDGEEKNRLCKDANEILYCYGADAILQLIKKCEPAPVKGILNIAQIKIPDPTSVPRIITRVPSLDNMIAGFGEGQFVVLSGKRGSGKSTIGGSFLLNAVEQGYKCCIYSGELSSAKVFEWLCQQACEAKYIERVTDPRSGKVYGVVREDIQERIRKWLDQKVYLYDNSMIDDCPPDESVMKVFNIAAKRYGCKVFLCDNLMSLLFSADEENKAQAKLAGQLKQFAVKYKATVLCVCHPRKTKKEETITNDDVAGSSVITNMADTVLCIERPNIRVLKNRDFGSTGLVICNYDPANHRIFEAKYGDNTRYEWDHVGIPEAQNPAANSEGFEIVLGGEGAPQSYPPF